MTGIRRKERNVKYNNCRNEIRRKNNNVDKRCT